MKAIITFTVPGGKRLIAKAIARMPEVRRAQENGRIWLKGSTTVSAVAEELVGVPMRISGRITPRGLKGAHVVIDAPHNMLIEGSRWSNADVDLAAAAASLREGDLVISGANIIDAQGGAAVMGGSTLGGRAGRVFAGVMSEGIPIIVAAGLEKLIPGTVQQAVMAAGRFKFDRCMGMAVGLMPIVGKVITEIEAIKLLASVEGQVIGKGGMDGAEGGVTLAISGAEEEVDRMLRLALELRDATLSGLKDSLVECGGACQECHKHRGCLYKSPKLLARYVDTQAQVAGS